MTGAYADPRPDTVPPLRVAVVGCGRRGLDHMHALRRLDGVSLAAVCDVAEEAMKAAADRFHVVGRHTSLVEMLDNEALDAVFVAPPAHLYRPGT